MATNSQKIATLQADVKELKATDIKLSENIAVIDNQISDIKKNQELMLLDLQRLASLHSVVTPPDPEPTILKAFPSAIGAGANATGGRGGAVIHVTTLDWNGVGGLKNALETSGARTIVFDVSGEIDASLDGDYYELSNPNYDDVTIAGQSAPNGGITIKTPYFSFSGLSNVIFRYVRFRDSNTLESTDCIWMQKANNVVFDHCSLSHARDETLDISYSQGTSGNVTVQNCLLSDSKTGMILGTDTRGEAIPLADLGDFTCANNVFTGISHRFPNPQGKGHYDIINNVVYNWKERLVRITQGGTYNILNNYYKPSAEGLNRSGWFSVGNIPASRMQKVQAQTGNLPMIHTKGNVISNQRTAQTDDKDMFTYFAGSSAGYTENAAVSSSMFTDTQFPLAGVEFDIKTAIQAYIDVLENAGACKTLNADGTVNFYRDSKDAADILMIQNDTFVSNSGSDFEYIPTTSIPYPTLPNNTRPVGFYGVNQHIPQAYLAAKGVTNTTTVHNDISNDGLYTWLERYLNEVDN